MLREYSISTQCGTRPSMMTTASTASMQPSIFRDHSAGYRAVADEFAGLAHRASTSLSNSRRFAVILATDVVRRDEFYL
jgi:hypothetical protein